MFHQLLFYQLNIIYQLKNHLIEIHYEIQCYFLLFLIFVEIEKTIKFLFLLVFQKKFFSLKKKKNFSYFLIILIKNKNKK
jgi:hypothetical protein